MEKAVHLIPGMVVEVTLLIDVGEGSRGSGAFVCTDPVKFYDGKYYDLLHGFALEDTDVGELTPLGASDETGGVTVLYTHKKPEKNTIYFWTFEGNMDSISIVGVPIHDHSSIIQGGPAFGTYFTDDEVI